MLRCKEVTRLCASDEIRSAPLMTRLGVRVHLMMCRHCRRYVRELARIGDAVRALYRDQAEAPERDEAIVRRVLSAQAAGDRDDT
jgi:anti-sigma factor RsiW